VAYRAEIEIAVKGARDLTQFQGKLKATALEVEQLNKFLEAFSQDAEGIPRSIANLNRQLNQASNAFNDVALGTEEARTAAVDYLAATRNLNAGLRERANLLAEVAENERRVKLASAGIRERTQYSGPIGPGEASSINALVGQSSEVAGRVQRIKDIKDDQRALDEALLNLEKKSAAELNKKVQLQESLVEGTREVLELVAEAQRRQQRTAPAERLAQSSIKEAAEREARFEARKTFAGQIFDIEKNFSKQLNDADLEFLRKKFIVEEDIQKQLFDRAIALDKEEGKAFDAELKRRTEAKAAAIKKENRIAEQVARRRKEALGSAIIGGAFPLLFGQGIGAAVGGGAGGAAGGLIGGQFGFGLALVGTALGSSFDALAKDAAELGAALDSVTGDANAVAKAAGLTGTDLGMLIENLEQAGDKTQAMALATRELEEIVGEQGVRALRDFSATAEQMGQDLEALATRIKALFAGIANVVFPPETTKRLEETKAIERARRSNDPKVQQAVRDYFDQSNFESLGLKEGVDARLAARQKILDLVKQEQDEMLRIRSLTEDVAQKEREKTAEQETSLSIAKARLIVEKNNGDILNATVEASLRAIAAEETRLKLIQAAGDARLIDLALTEAATRKAEIDNQILAAREALSRKLARAEGKAAESKALSLQRDILRERLNLFNVDEQIARVGLDRLDILRREEEAILIRRDTEIKLLELARQDALNKNKVKADEALINELHDARISKVNKTAALAKEENSALIQRITLERELTKLAGERETEDIGIDLKRQVEAVNRRISNPFGGQDSEMLELRIQQVQRQEDAYRALDRQIADVNRRLEDAPDNVDLKQELGLLEGRKRKYAELLPILDQVQQEELRLQQTLQQLQPLTNALSQGLTDLFTGLIDGSKSAQEVFADMLKNMGQALIKQGAVMITQYIAIGIARAFALRQSPSIGTRASDFNLPGFGNLESTGGNVFTGFTPRANGGPVSTGTPYMVGERGPELFVPSNSGTIVPNNALGGDVNVVVNVTETQTDTRGNGARANQVGNALAAAVQAEIIKQKRPGGLLAN